MSSWTRIKVVFAIITLFISACGTAADSQPDTGGTDTGGTDTAGTDNTGTDTSGTGETTLQSIQELSAAMNCVGGDSPFLTHIEGLSLEGVVVVSPRFNAFTPEEEGNALDGYFVADQAGGMYSGTQLVVSKSAATDYQIGDLLSVEGSATDFYCMTQVSADVATLTGQGEAPTPSLVTADTFATGAEIEKYEGTLVEIHDLVPNDEPNQWGEYDIDGVIVDDKFMFNDLNLTVGETISKLVGIVNYSYGKYMILPRSAADIEVAAPEATDP